MTGRCTRRLLGWLLVLLGTLSLASDARAAAEASFTLREADGQQIAEILHRVLGAPVTVRLRPDRRVTLAVRAESVDAAFERLAGKLRGSWTRWLRLEPAGPRRLPRPRFPQAARVTLRVRDVSAGSVLKILARSAGARLAPGRLPDTRLTLDRQDAPVEEVLDEVAASLGLQWRYAYEIRGPGGASSPAVFSPTPILSSPAPPPALAAPRATVRVPVAASSASPGPRLPEDRRRRAGGGPLLPRLPRSAAPEFTLESSAQLREGLRSELRALLRADPAKRPAAIANFVRRVRRLFRQLDDLQGNERNLSEIALRQVRTAWGLIYRGLAPSLQREFAPVNELLTRPPP